MSRTGLDATTLADSLRVMAGDNSIEWVAELIQASVLLDIADMLDQYAKLREELTAPPQCETCEAMLDCDECLRADESAKERKRLDYENAKLRELCAGFWQALKGDTQDCPFVICEYMYECSDDECVYERMMQELGVEVQK